MKRSYRGPILALMVLGGGAPALAQPAEAPAQNPRSQGALRHVIETVSAGQPDYSAMSPSAAAATKANLAALREPLSDLGLVQALTFVQVDKQGRDAYSVTFVNGMADLTIAMNAEGKVEAWDIAGPMTRPAGDHH